MRKISVILILLGLVGCTNPADPTPTSLHVADLAANPKAYHHHRVLLTGFAHGGWNKYGYALYPNADSASQESHSQAVYLTICPGASGGYSSPPGTQAWRHAGSSVTLAGVLNATNRGPKNVFMATLELTSGIPIRNPEETGEPSSGHVPK